MTLFTHDKVNSYNYINFPTLNYLNFPLTRNKSLNSPTKNTLLKESRPTIYSQADINTSLQQYQGSFAHRTLHGLLYIWCRYSFDICFLRENLSKDGGRRTLKSKILRTSSISSSQYFYWYFPSVLNTKNINTSSVL